MLLHTVALTSQDGLRRNTMQHSKQHSTEAVQRKSGVSTVAGSASPHSGCYQSEWTVGQYNVAKQHSTEAVQSRSGVSTISEGAPPMLWLLPGGKKYNAVQKQCSAEQETS